MSLDDTSPTPLAANAPAVAPAPSLAVQRAERITALLDRDDWASLSERLTKFAHACMRRRDWEAAEDVAQQAIATVLDIKYKAWDPDREPDIFDHLSNVARGIISNRRRDRATQRERSTARAKLEAIAPASPDGDPETQLADKEAAKKLAERLGEELAGDMLALRLVALHEEGITKPRDQAAAAGVPVDEIHNARKRLVRSAAELARELGLREGDDDAAA